MVLTLGFDSKKREVHKKTSLIAYGQFTNGLSKI